MQSGGTLIIDVFDSNIVTPCKDKYGQYAFVPLSSAVHDCLVAKSPFLRVTFKV